MSAPRRFEARNSTEAMNQVKQAFGADFMIYKNEKTPNGVVIVAGPFTEVPLQPKDETRPSLDAITGFDFKARLSAVTEQDDELKPQAPVSKLKAASQAYRQSKGGAAYASQAADPISLPSKPEPQAATPNETTFAAEEHIPEPVLEVFEAEEVMEQNEIPPEVQSDSAQRFEEDLKTIQAVASWSKHLLGDTHKLQTVVRERLLPRIAESGTYADLQKLLTAAGFKSEMSAAVLKNLPREVAERRLDPLAMSKWVEQALVAQIRTMQSPDLWWGERAVVPIVGASGSGKTTAVAKLAARFSMDNDPTAVTIITLDPDHSDKLKVCADVLGVQMLVLQEYQDLAEALAKLKHKQLVLIDTPGFGYRSKKLAPLMKRLAVAGQPVLPVMVLNANAESKLLDITVQTYAKHSDAAGLALKMCAISKLDDAVSIGGALSVVDQYQLTITYQSESSDILEDFDRASAINLAKLAFEGISAEEHAALGEVPYQDGRAFNAHRDELLESVNEMSSVLVALKRELKGAGLNTTVAEVSGLVEQKKVPQFPLQAITDQSRQQHPQAPSLLWYKDNYPVESVSYRARTASVQ